MDYYDQNKNIRAELLDREAYNQAENFIEYFFDRRTQQKKVSSNKSLSSSQLRKFFNEFKQLEKKVNIEGFEKVKPLIKMVKSKASYASKKIHPEFKKFLIGHVDKINTDRDFKAFMLHFEAVVGFFYGFEGIKNN